MTDTIGLDYNSARECTPRWYGVSFGNGNDGVSHLFPAYYVRTADPWRLARIAILSRIVDGYQAKAAEELEFDGDSDYTIYAMILNPPDEEIGCERCGQPISCDDGTWKDEFGNDRCGTDDYHEPSEEDWCSVNGAWMICEVFPLHPFQVDIYNGYTSMEEAFTADELKLGED